MSTTSKRSPTLCRHKRTGHAYAKFHGRQVWFGRYDAPQAHEEFARTLAVWQANGCYLPPAESAEITVSEVVSRYIAFAERYYCRQDGTPTREVNNIRDAVRPLLELYASLAIARFGVREMKVIRERLIDRGLARSTINDRLNRIVRVVGWAAEEELCAPEVYGGLKAVRPLRRGRSRAKESKRVGPVSREQVEVVLAYVSRPVAGILEVMWHTGMRPGEACQLRPADLDMTGSVWFYRPQSHKTENYGRDRVIAIGPRGQRVLRGFLERVPRPDPESPLFQPCQAMAELRVERRRRRATPLWSSHVKAQERRRQAVPRKKPGQAYTPNSLLGAVKRACKRAKLEPWSPNQIRHAAASRIRKEIGLEAARAVLGHSSAQVTEIYAELDRELAEKTMSRLG